MKRGPWRRERHNERGQVLPLVAIAMLALCGMAGLAIDVGNAYLHQKRLKAAVDLGMVTGAQKLPDTTKAGDDARLYIQTNWEKRDTGTVDTTVTTGCMVAGCAQPDKLSVSAKATVPATFAKLFGKDNFTVSAKGAACGPCDAKAEKYDIVVVLDRSYSMCLGGPSGYSGCYDLDQAKEGVRSLLKYFDPNVDRVGLVTLSSQDDASPFDHTGSDAPCDSANPSDANHTVKVNGNNVAARFYKTAGDFMDGTDTDHDSWLIAPLAGGFKNDNGTLNTDSPLVSRLECIQHKYWTPIAPAIKQAADVLSAAPRPEVARIMVVFGDGGANMQPMKRRSDGRPQGTTYSATTRSWYTPSPTKTDNVNSQTSIRACYDAISQATDAKARTWEGKGIEIYTIGYDLNSGSAQDCERNNDRTADSTINAEDTLRRIATDDSHFYEKASAGEVYTIFQKIGRRITGSGVRIVE